MDWLTPQWPQQARSQQLLWSPCRVQGLTHLVFAASSRPLGGLDGRWGSQHSGAARTAVLVSQAVPLLGAPLDDCPLFLKLEEYPPHA